MSTTLVCPGCGASAAPDTTFCMQCGKYLGWADEPGSAASAESAGPVPAAPAAEPPPPAAPVPSPAATPTTAATDKPCGTCGVLNPGGRRFCLQCGAMLSAAAAPAPPEPRSVRPNRRLPTIVSAVLAIVVVAVVAGILTRSGDDKDKAAPSTPGATTTVATTIPAATRIDPTTITASASSVLAPEGPYTYGLNNTLDNNLDTAWNDGAPGPGVGEKLTFRFARPVQLATIRLINGYASSLTELFEQNGRIRAVIVVTDTGRFPVTLTDVRDRQELTMDFGRTSSVILEVVTVYPGTRYDDLALTEIEFFARPVS